MKKKTFSHTTDILNVVEINEYNVSLKCLDEEIHELYERNFETTSSSAPIEYLNGQRRFLVSIGIYCFQYYD